MTRQRKAESGASAAAAAPDGIRYAPFRRPEETVLYCVVQEHLATFLARSEEGGPLPRFVKRELEAFLECGIPSHGCASTHYVSLSPPDAGADHGDPAASSS